MLNTGLNRKVTTKAPVGMTASMLFLAAGMACLASRSMAQTVSWQAPNNGDWNAPSNWSGGFPDSNSETAVLGLSGGYEVLLNASYQIGGLQIPNPEAILNFQAGRSLTIVNSVLLDGSIVVNSTGSSSGTAFVFSRSLPGAVPISGTGTIYLNANFANLDTAYMTTVNNTVVSIGSGVTIRGLGRIYGRYQHAGLIVADDLFGGILELRGTILQGTGAIEANGATLRLSESAQITSIPMTASNGGGFAVVSGSNTFKGVNLTGPLALTNAQLNVDSCSITGDVTVSSAPMFVTSPNLTLNGNMLINPTANGGGTYLQFNQSGSLLGAGTITLNANASNLDTAALYTGANVVTSIEAGRVIEGAGRVSGRYQLAGKIRATDSFLGRPLRLVDVTITRTGAGNIEADGGQLQVNSPTVPSQITNVPMTATNGGSFAVIGGTNTLTGVNLTGPLAITNAQLNVDSCSITGDVTVSSAPMFVTSPNLTLNGNMLINPTANGGGTYLQFNQSGSLLGAGTITLNANLSNFDTAYVSASGNATATMPSGRALKGTGRTYGKIAFGGVVSPSNYSTFSQIGQLDIRGPFTFASTSSFEADVASPSSFDRITGDGTKALNGTLVLRLLNGFIARPANVLPIISGSAARTGVFDSIVPPTGYAAVPTYTATGLNMSLARTCPADLNADVVVDDADFSLFVVAYDILDCNDAAMTAWCPADLNNDNLVDDADFAVFVGGYDQLLCP